MHSLFKHGNLLAYLSESLAKLKDGYSYVRPGSSGKLKNENKDLELSNTKDFLIVFSPMLLLWHPPTGLPEAWLGCPGMCYVSKGAQQPTKCTGWQRPTGGAVSMTVFSLQVNET